MPPANKWVLPGVLVLLFGAHLALDVRSEPFFNNDETRHVMTGIFFRDALQDRPVEQPREYTVRYYLQYPALGLLTWPPFFYMVEGGWMSLFGTGVMAAKALMGVFVAIACAYFFVLVRQSQGEFKAALATLILGLAPQFFTYSRHVMLELPTLACGLAAVAHFVWYLDSDRRRHLWLAALASALTALTRFDGLYLLPLFGILLVARRQLGVLLRWEVWLAGLAAIALVTPYYGLTLHEFGWVHFKAASTGTSGTSTSFLDPCNFWYYIQELPAQVGWFALAAAVIGLATLRDAQARRTAWPFLAMILATYGTFAPMAELETRHTICWIPGFAYFAAVGVTWIAERLAQPALRGPLAALVIAGTVWTTSQSPALYVRGYEDAARYVLAETSTSPCCLFDNFLNGNFVYQVRHADPERRLWVLRGDKLFYSVLSDPHGGYAEYVRGEDGILATIFKYDPEFIVVEDRQIYFEPSEMPMAELLRATLRNHPERFQLEREFAIESNVRMFEGVKLLVYRNLHRNPDRARSLELEMLGLQRSIQTALPGKD